MRALSRSRSRPQLGAAQVAASTRDAVEDALRAVHHELHVLQRIEISCIHGLDE